jgi:hypothetical protein
MAVAEVAPTLPDPGHFAQVLFGSVLAEADSRPRWAHHAPALLGAAGLFEPAPATASSVRFGHHPLFESVSLPNVFASPRLTALLRIYGRALSPTNLKRFVRFVRAAFPTTSEQDALEGASALPVSIFFWKLAEADVPSLRLLFLPGAQKACVRSETPITEVEQSGWVELLHDLIGERRTPTSTGWAFATSQWSFWRRYPAVFYALCAEFGAPGRWDGSWPVNWSRSSGLEDAEIAATTDPLWYAIATTLLPDSTLLRPCRGYKCGPCECSQCRTAILAWARVHVLLRDRLMACIPVPDLVALATDFVLTSFPPL